MGQDVRNDSRVCRTPPGPMKKLNLYSKPNPILVAVSLTFILMTSGLVYYWMLPLPSGDDGELTPHATIAIDGDANFTATAMREGWPGDGFPENPYLIDGLNIDLSGERSYCISIENTRVSFTISNCSLIGDIHHPIAMPAWDAVGIYLENVTNGKIVNNICKNNSVGIFLFNSAYNVVANNTCRSNSRGILLKESESNIVTNNICNSSFYFGIWLAGSDSNTVKNNTCNNNYIGIKLHESDSNTVANNTCNNE
ncbi:MAG: NosD domain-containing protein, partial [Candidatus Thorarchaeota archaeon]